MTIKFKAKIETNISKFNLLRALVRGHSREENIKFILHKINEIGKIRGCE